jgi:spore coat polysaccharide biosynthesis protein SpsF
MQNILSKYNTIAIIQARMRSSRLPGKSMMDIAGRPMLEWVIRRVKRSSLLNLVMVATTTDTSDNPIEVFCKKIEIPVFRGSMNDVLDRYYQAAKLQHADIIVRVTSDCPLIDPEIIDMTILALVENQADFACNRLPPPMKRTYPIGLDVEVVRFEALERAWRETNQNNEREHVMPYLYDKPGRFKVIKIDHAVDYGSMRWTVDTSKDLEFVRQIYAHLKGRDDFSWLEVLDLVKSRPELANINAGVAQKSYLDFDIRDSNKEID